MISKNKEIKWTKKKKIAEKRKRIPQTTMNWIASIRIIFKSPSTSSHLSKALELQPQTQTLGIRWMKTNRNRERFKMSWRRKRAKFGDMFAKNKIKWTWSLEICGEVGSVSTRANSSTLLIARVFASPETRHISNFECWDKRKLFKKENLRSIKMSRR